MAPKLHDSLEAAVQERGRQLLEEARQRGPSIFDRSYWQGKILDWAMQDPGFRTDLFRFVDVLPTLKSASAIAEHVQDYLLERHPDLPTSITATLKAASSGWGAGIASKQIRRNVESLARTFIAGADIKDALATIDDLRAQQLAISIDLLGEACVSEWEAEVYLRRYRETATVLAKHVQQWAAQPVADQNALGPIPRANVSIKLSSLYSQIDAADWEGSKHAILARLLPLCLEARQRDVFVNIDMEHWDLHGLTQAVFADLCMHPELKDWPHLGIVLQAYLRSAPEQLSALVQLARVRGTPFSVRLVKGAYWDMETLLSDQRGWPCPVWQHKHQTDHTYEQLTVSLLQNSELLWPAFASHNVRSLVHAICAAEQLDVPPEAYELQMLYGMAEGERSALSKRGYRIRVYTPVGEFLPGMAYLVRRLLENTSNQGFLRLSHHDRADTQELLAPPSLIANPQSTRPKALVAVEPTLPFRNCPLTDFGEREERAQFRAAVDAVGKSLPLRSAVVVANSPKRARRTVENPCPSDLSRTVAISELADSADVALAVDTATQSWVAWNRCGIEERSERLIRLAQLLEDDRYRFAALLCWEVGKPWREADAEVAEAIDFCRYYARQAALELAPRAHAVLGGEHNTLQYEGRGVSAVIAPWNFPLAILCGMSTAALVAGNSVIMKPAEQAPATGFALFEAMIQAGIPAGVVQFLPGLGEDIGATLVEHPAVTTVAFTGSKAVGMQILHRQTAPSPDFQVRRVICEMGGKNAIIVDEDADLDEAVSGVLSSAFGYAGQKCSACSRAIVVGAVYEEFIQRIRHAAASMHVGPTYDPANKIGPVIDREAYDRLMELLANIASYGQVIYQADTRHEGFYVPPTLVAVSDPNSLLMQEELFGPVVAICHVKTFDDALTVANASRYALTGGLYSRLPTHIARARREFRVGNLYVNRGCTGAFVHRQPFGGFKMSGFGQKAGGPGYLQQFADARCITENTVRRGFAGDSTSS